MNLILWGGMFVGGIIAAVLLARGSSSDEEVVQPVRLEAAVVEPAEEENQDADQEPAAIERLVAHVSKRHPHARDAFTQGLLWYEDVLYESTGQYGESSLRLVDPKTGDVLDRQDLDATFFGEGLARVGDRLVQLTWKEGTAFFWQLANLEPIKTVSYKGQGWGLCYNGTDLAMTDGSATMTFRDPDTLVVRREVEVVQEGRKVFFLNELECVGDDIYANIWHSEKIVRIDSQSGRVTAVIDASRLLTIDERQDVDVLNGIAYVPETKRFLITGKRWPYIFEVEFVPESELP